MRWRFSHELAIAGFPAHCLGLCLKLNTGYILLPALKPLCASATLQWLSVAFVFYDMWHVLKFGVVAINPVKCFFKWHWAGDAEPLNMITAQLREQNMFAHGFHPFGECFDAQPFCHRQDRADHALLFGIAVGFHDKRAVNFDSTYREPANGSDGGMTGAKIIQINTAAQRAQCVDVAGDHVIGGGCNNGFKNFDSKPLGCQFKPVQLPSNFVQQFGIVQL